MPVNIEKGDIFATTGIRGFAHGCNCAGAMGKGIAVAFRSRWPAMYDEYRRRCKSGSFRLGDVFVWEQAGEVVYNLGTQESWTTKAVLSATEKALKEMIKDAENRGVTEIALPRIGAGLGGLRWEDVRLILQRLGDSTSVLLRVCYIFVGGQPLTPISDLERSSVIDKSRHRQSPSSTPQR